MIPPRLLTVQGVAARIGFGKTWIYEQVAAGTFPAPLMFGRFPRWDIEDIDAWVDAKKHEQQGARVGTGAQEARP